MKGHLKHMLIAGGAILAVLVVLRVDLRAALPYAIALACPLGMIFMMRGGHGHDHGAGTPQAPGQENPAAHDHAAHQAGADATPTATEPPQTLTRENHERIV